MELLFKLHEELGRLYIAGSKNAINDPRIKKYIPSLEKLAEKSKVFLSLKESLEALITGSEEESFANLSKVFALINSILVTQVNLSCEKDDFEEIIEKDKKYNNILTYKQLDDYINTCKNLEENEILNTFGNDVRLYKFLDKFITSPYRDENLYKTLCKLDESVGIYLLENFNIENKKTCADRLKYIKSVLTSEAYKIELENLAKRIIEEKHTKVIPEAIEVLGYNIENEEIVLAFSKTKKLDYIESSIIALHKMGSKETLNVLKSVGENNFGCCIDAIHRLTEMYDDESYIVDSIDYMFNQYMKKIEKMDKKINDMKNETIEISVMLSRLEYDKYHSFFESLFELDWVFDENVHTGFLDLTMFNLISNDIRYNALIYNSIGNYLGLNENSSMQKHESIYSGKNEIFYYYLVVVKNLFDEKEATKRSIEFLSFCKNIDILTKNFKKNTYYYFNNILVFLGREIKIEKIDKLDLKEKYEVYKESENINKDVYDFLFHDTFFFQATLGEGYYNKDILVLVNLYNESPELIDKFLEKMLVFVKEHLGGDKTLKYNIAISRYHFHHLIRIDDERFARTFFDILLYMFENSEDLEKSKSEIKKIIDRIKTLDNYEKYKYLLDDKKLKKLEFILE